VFCYFLKSVGRWGCHALLMTCSGTKGDRRILIVYVIRLGYCLDEANYNQNFNAPSHITYTPNWEVFTEFVSSHELLSHL